MNEVSNLAAKFFRAKTGTAASCFAVDLSPQERAPYLKAAEAFIAEASKPRPGQAGTATVEGKPNVAGTWIRSYNGGLYFATHEASTSTGNLADSSVVDDFIPDAPAIVTRVVTHADPSRADIAHAIAGYETLTSVHTAAADRVISAYVNAHR